MKTKKQLLVTILSLCIFFSLMPSGAFASIGADDTSDQGIQSEQPLTDPGQPAGDPETGSTGEDGEAVIPDDDSGEDPGEVTPEDPDAVLEDVPVDNEDQSPSTESDAKKKAKLAPKAAGRVVAIREESFNDDGDVILSTQIAISKKTPDENTVYQLKTGQNMTYTIAISNSDTRELSDAVRVYFDFSGEHYTYGTFPPKDEPYTLKNNSGTEYQMSVVQCKDDAGNPLPGKFYYELTGIKNGETLSFQNDMFYPSPESAGGTLKIWTKTIDADDVGSAEYDGKYIPPEQFIELNWATEPVSRTVQKTLATSRNGKSVKPYYVGDGSGNDSVYLRDYGYVIRENTSGTSTGEGQDLVRTVDYSDTLTLPATSTEWREGILDAIESGDFKVRGEQVTSSFGSSGYYGYSVYATVDGQDILVCQLADQSFSNGNSSNSSYYKKTGGIEDLTPSVVTGSDGKRTIRLDWKNKNQYITSDSASREYPAKTFSLAYGNQAIVGSIDELSDLKAEGKLPEFTNHVDETRHYSWSEDQVSEANVTTPVNLDERLVTAKYWDHGGNYQSVPGGSYYPFTLLMENTGLVNLKNWGDTSGQTVTPMISDPMNFRQYIAPADIEKMFAAKEKAGDTTYNVGDWLTIEISPASLYTVDEGRETTYGQELYAEDSANPTDKYQITTRPANDGSLLTDKAKITFTKEDGKIVMTISGSGAAGKDGSYTIGEDYASVDEAFKKLGYMPTRSAIYTLKWQPCENEYTLKSGQRLLIHVPASFKNSFMMMTDDNANSHGESNSFRNAATFTSTYGDQLHKDTRYTDYRYWSSEVSLGKSGTNAAGGSINQQNVVISDGDILDFCISGSVNYYTFNTNYNYDTGTYQSRSSETRYINEGYVPFTDLIVGAQVALVDKSTNPDLTAPDGSALPTVTANGRECWVLNKPGTYTNVKFGTSSKNGSSYRTAETITVTSEGKKGLRTLIKWAPQPNFGSSSNRSTNYWYKTIVSGSLSGMVTSPDIEDLTFSFDNKAWMGEHQRHRLYATLQKTFYIYGTSKYIMTDTQDPKDPANTSTLMNENRISRDQTVSYIMKVENRSEFPTVIKGNQIFDMLPQTRGVYAWSKDNVTNIRYQPVKGEVYMEGPDGSRTDTWNGSADGSWENGGEDSWSIKTTSPTSSSETTGQYYIRWDDNFRISLEEHGSVYIMVDITFPGDADDGTSPWSQFVNKNNGEYLYNRFYVHDQNTWHSDWARHLPLADVKATLRKGVYDTGWTTKDGRSSTWGYTYNSRRSRTTYANSGDTRESSSDLHASTVTYYVELYNGGNERLYLENMQDLLPRGFTFNTMANVNYNNTNDWDNWTVDRKYIGYGGNSRINSRGYASYEIRTEGNNYSDADRFATVNTSIDDEDFHKPVYVNAHVTATPQTRDGRTYVTFKFDNSGCTNYSNHPAVSYDSEAKKYYLNPGETIRFGYNTIPGKEDATDPVADNAITMPFNNYYQTKFTLDDYKKLEPSKKNGLAANDGECEQMTAEQVKNRYGFNTDPYTAPNYDTEKDGNWLVSSVDLSRTEMVPGTQKSVGGSTPGTNADIQGSRGDNSGKLYGDTYTGGIKSSDIVNWRVRVFSDNNTMQGYKLVDTADTPYKFTGQVFYNGYRTSGNSTINETGSRYLFTIGNRSKDDTSVRINTGSTLSGASTLPIGNAEDDGDDQWYTFGTGANAGRVKIEKLSDGREQMTIELNGAAYAVGENRYFDFCLHTKFCDDVIVISDGKYNDVILKPDQDYRTASVAQGQPLTHTETIDGKRVTVNDGIEAGASVMLVQGYTTSSYKMITEIGNNQNTGRSDGENGARNQITLSEKDKTVRYDLHVKGPKAIMSKIVLIDALPQPGDHSAFVESDKRNSKFQVGLLASDPGFHVYLKKKGGSEKELSASQYTIEVTTRTEFSDSDWRGDAGDWIALSDATESDLENARAFRIILADPNGYQTNSSLYMMPDETDVHFAFNARIDDEDASPGDVAWNSFGYYYTVPETFGGTEENSITTNLNSQPLNVGIRFPASPTIEKQLVDENGDPRSAEQDLTFGFIVYKGEALPALDKADTMTKDEASAILDQEGRDYIYVPVTVAKGESSASAGLWKKEFDDMRWTNNEKFTVVELSSGDYRYAFKGINESGNNCTLTNDIAESIVASSVNQYDPEYVDVTGRKIWDDGDDQDRVRPEEITVHLLADGDEIDSCTATADDRWAFSFEHLLKYKEDGTIIEYTLEEDPVENYDTVIEDTTEGTQSKAYTFEITNTHEPATLNIEGTKVWDDADDKDGMRPGSITVKLLADGEEVDTQTVKAGKSGEWNYTFEDLPKYNAGEEIEYTVAEEEVAGYTSEVSGDMENGFVITNRHEPAEEPAANDNGAGGIGTGDSSNLALWMTVMLAAAVCLAGILVRKRRNDQ